MRDLWDEVFMPLSAFLLLLLIIMGIAAAIVFPIAKASCAAQAKKMELEYSWGLFQDCMIRVDGRWEPIEWQRSMRIKPQ